ETETGGRDRTSTVADTFEAVIGAVYIDQGIEAARRFIGEQLLVDARRIVRDSTHTNYKSILQEHIQGEHRVHPHYRVLSESGPEHEKLFTVQVSVRGRILGTGKGKSKKEAEQAAARHALDKLELLPKE
ncbi:MAG: putative dsRNA-binding protein, partial [Candidatus Eisenbacteria bacterium]